MTTRLRLWAIGLAMTALVLAALATAGDAGFWRRYLAALEAGSPHVPAHLFTPRETVAGGGAQTPPRDEPAMQGVAPEAITAALALARQQDARAVLVHRHGHRIAEYLAPGVSPATLVGGGELSPLPWALAWGALAEAGRVDAAAVLAAVRNASAAGRSDAWRNPWSAQARRLFSRSSLADTAGLPAEARSTRLLSSHVWQALGAADAEAWVDAAGAARIDCCFVAALGDWQRLADLLLQQGRYAGERVVSAQWVRELLPGDTGPTRRLLWTPASAAATGDEPPAARDAIAIDLEAGLRLWLSPQRGIAVLYWEKPGSGLASDTALPNVVFRGITDSQAVPVAVPLGDIVPGH